MVVYTMSIPMSWGYCRENPNIEKGVGLNKTFFKDPCNLGFNDSNDTHMDMVNVVHLALTYLVLLIL